MGSLCESLKYSTPLDDHDMDLRDGMGADHWAPDYDDDEGLPEVPEMSRSSTSLKLGQVSTFQLKSFTAASMSKLVSTNAGDYSFFDNSRIDFLAGPRHWTLKRPRGR